MKSFIGSNCNEAVSVSIGVDLSYVIMISSNDDNV